VERFIGDFALENELKVTKLTDETNPEKVAVIGAGPSGLSAAYHLARMGYKVKVFEGAPKAGGMLRYGIPDYRLPQDVLDKEIARIESLGVEIECNQMIGGNIEYRDLQEKYDAIYVGIWSSERKTPWRKRRGFGKCFYWLGVSKFY
jgi:NADPH-dependent glutamate synthase beta subunit-like oxidoreductase